MSYPSSSKVRKNQNFYAELLQHRKQKPLEQKQPFSSLLAGVIGVGVVVVACLTFSEWRTPPILLLQANDDSTSSAQAFGTLSQQLCQTATQRLKYRDTIVWLSFADRTEVTKTVTLWNSFDLLGQCQQIGEVASSSVGEHPGTSLMRLSDRLPRVIINQRNQGNTVPVVVPILIHEAEPGPGQPTVDWTHIRTQFQKITADRGIVVITGPTGQLQADMETYLGDIPGVRLCPSADSSACLEAAIEAARKL